MSAVRIFIADDEAPARERLKELLEDIAGELPNDVVGEARHGLEAVERVPASGAQVLLLDIEMPGMGGLEVARHLAALEQPPRVVFVTAHDRHAVEAFELNALDYLLKPVRAERLAAALKKAEADVSSEQKAIDADRRAMTTDHSELQTSLERITRERAEIVTALDKQVLLTFEQIARKRNGVAVAEARDGVCTICHVRLRPQVFNTVRRNESIVQCDSCNRILFFVPVPATAASPDDVSQPAS